MQVHLIFIVKMTKHKEVYIRADSDGLVRYFDEKMNKELEEELQSKKTHRGNEVLYEPMSDGTLDKKTEH